MINLETDLTTQMSRPDPMTKLDWSNLMTKMGRVEWKPGRANQHNGLYRLVMPVNFVDSTRPNWSRSLA